MIANLFEAARWVAYGYITYVAFVILSMMLMGFVAWVKGIPQFLARELGYLIALLPQRLRSQHQSERQHPEA